MADRFQATKSRHVCLPAPQICLARSWCVPTISAAASASARSRANRPSFGRRRTLSRRHGSCRRSSRLAQMSAAGSASCRHTPHNPVSRSQDETDRKVCRRRLARNVPSASRRTGPLHPGRAQLQVSPCSSRDAKVVPACRTPLQAPQCRAQVLPRARRAAIKVSATNAISARGGQQHQTRPAPRPQRVLRQVHRAMKMKAEEMCGEHSLGGISAA